MKENKKGFKLSKVNWIFALIVIGLSTFIFLKRDGVNAYSLGHISGTLVTTGIIPLLFAFLVWLVQGRKPYAGTYTFNFVLILLCFGIIKEIGIKSQEQTDSIDSMTKSMSDYKDKISNDEDGVTAYQEYIVKIDDGISKMIRNSSGNEREVYKNLQKFTTINSSVMFDWQNAFDSVSAPRILDYSVLSNQQEFEYQLDVLRHYQKQSKLYQNHFENRKSLIVELNKNVPNENQTLKGVMKGINSKDSIQKTIFKPLIKSHINYSSNLIEMIEFLNVNNEKWKYLNDELIFDNSDLHESYMEIIKMIAEDENQINKLTDMLIEVM